jgi:uncharacterized protein YjbI with pentapeptide repeats
MSLAAAGSDLSMVRATLADLARESPAAHSDKQAAATDVCQWLRFALGPGRGLCPGQAELKELAREALAIIVSKLQDPGSAETFCGLDLDLSSIVLNELGFAGAQFTAGTVSFRNCRFGPGVSFEGAQFSGARVVFDGSTFTGTPQRGGGEFARTVFSGSTVSFTDSVFFRDIYSFDDTDFRSGQVTFDRVQLSDSVLSFVRARFTGAFVTFNDAVLRRGAVNFSDARVSDGELRFDRARLWAATSLSRLVIDGGNVSFDNSEVSALVSLTDLTLNGGSLSTRGMTVTNGLVDFRHLVVDGGVLTMDGIRAHFGNVDLREVSFLRGSVSLRGVQAPFDGIIYLPWATYTHGRKQVHDATFDIENDHEFMVTVARYRPGVITDWGPLKP